MRKIIRIFLGSSITEFAIERKDIENFIYNISDEFEENYDIKIKPLLCENLDNAYSKIRAQEIINDKVRQSDFCFFIFFTKAGTYTEEEFEVARKKFEESGKPKIYTYFKVLGDKKAEDSLLKFKEKLDKVFEHYYGTFDHIDTIKLRILLVLKLQEMSFADVDIRNGNCIVDGKSVMSLDNVSEFANNGRLNLLENNLREMEDYLKEIKGKLDKNDSDFQEFDRAKREIINLESNIRTLQKRIFKVSLHMIQNLTSAEMSERQKKAYRFFEKGDLYEAVEELPSDMIMNDFMKSEQLYLGAIEDAARKCIKEQLLAINLLMQNVEVSSATEQKIIERYKLIIPIIKKYLIEIDAMYDYMMFLDNNEFVDDKEELLKVAKDLFEIYDANPSFRKLYSMYDTCNIIAENLNDNDPHINYYSSMAIKSLFEFLQNTEDKTSFSFAFDCMRVAELPEISDDKSIRLYNTAISVFKKFANSSMAQKQIEFCKQQIEYILKNKK
ncbi:MAG: hypothetical protein E7562_02390 [Ruminococcaceae bacterium]|nr:hypothetical protein [Oscillospiraceae bacterium]